MIVSSGNNINIDTVKLALGSNSNNIKDYFTTSAGINKWAKYKPVARNLNFALQDYDFANANYGLDISSVKSIDPAELFNSQTWSYIPPSGSSTQPYRLEDFRGYNTAATAPFTYVFPSNVSTAASTAYTNVLVKPNNNAEIDIADIGDLSLADGWRYAVAYKILNSSSIKLAYDTGDYNGGMSFDLTGLLPYNTYEGIVLYTRESNDYVEYQESVVLPDSKFSFYVSKTVSSYYAEVTVTNFDSIKNQMALSSSDISGFSFPQLSIRTTSTTFPSTTGYLSLEFTCYDEYEGLLGMFTISDTSNTFTHSGTGTTTHYIDFNQGSNIYFQDYGIYLDVYKVHIDIYVNKYSGSGNFMLKQRYNWEVIRNY